MFKSQKAPRDSETPDPVGSWREELKKHAGDHSPSTRSSEPSIEVDLDAADATPEVSAHEAVEKIVSSMTSLGGTDTPADRTSWTRLTEQATNHSDALRAALDAQQQAQSLLERATTERAEAAGQAEQILLEAQAMAARLNREAERNADRRHREITAWATDQRRAGEELVAELREAAVAEAEEVRVRAREEALAEAEKEASQHVARAMEEAQVEADAVRDRARDALEQSSSLIAETQVAMRMFNDSVSSFMVGLQRRAGGLEELLASLSSEVDQATRPEDTRVEFDVETDTAETDAVKTEEAETVDIEADPDHERSHDES